MTPRWLISVPVWGERYVNVFCATALPALERAILRLGRGQACLVVHTNEPDRILQAATMINIDTRPVPAGLRDFDCLSQAHREVLAMGLRDDRVVLLTADLVISEMGLVACAEAFEDNRTYLVACMGIRAVERGPLPSTTRARDLLSWAWQNRHPMTEACLWPEGFSSDMSRMYFSNTRSVVARLALPHPLVVRIDGRPLRFSPTIDVNLIKNFVPEEINLITLPDQLALVELSPLNKDFQVASETMHQRMVGEQFQLSDPMQQWCAGKRVVVIGTDEDCGDRIVDEQIERIRRKAQEL